LQSVLSHTYETSFIILESRANFAPALCSAFKLRPVEAMRQFPPSRIVCLTEETVETLYLLVDPRPT
jgi:hypothetical protein